MSTVAEVARQVLAAVASPAANHVLVSQWVARRLRELQSRSRMRHLRRIGTINIPAEVTTGTVTGTRGSAVLTGDATAVAAWQAIGRASLLGRHIRLSGHTTWYELIDWDGDTVLTLDGALGEDSASAVAYSIVRRYFTLPSEVRWLGDFVHMRRHRGPLAAVSRAELDALFPTRPYIGNGPDFVVDLSYGREASGRIIELYPASTEANVIHYAYWAEPPLLGPDDQIPHVVDDHILVEGALIDLYRHQESVAMAAGNVDAAGLWRNEQRAQKTQWERDILEVTKADKGMDDVTLIARSSGMQGAAPLYGDVTNAQSHVYAGWSDG